MTGQFDFDNNSDNLPVKPGMSTGKKILLALLVVVGLACLTCCGVGAYFYQNAVHKQPEEIRNDTAAIVEIAIPERFKPVKATNFVLARIAEYTTDVEGWQAGEGVGTLTLIDVDPAILSDRQKAGAKPEMKQEMEDEDGILMDLEELEEPEFTIRGQKCKFQFYSFKDKAGNVRHRIKGDFPSKTGTASLDIILPDAEYDKAEIVKMIESIH